MGKSRKEKHSKHKKDRHEDRHGGGRLSASPSREPGLRSQPSPSAGQKRRRQAERTPSPTPRRYEKKAARRAKARTPSPAPEGSPPILRRIRYQSRDEDTGPSEAPTRARRDRTEISVRFRDRLDPRPEGHRDRERETRDRHEKGSAPFVPEEQFWKQRKGISSSPRRDEDAYERPHRDSAPRDGDRASGRDGKGHVLARITFLSSPPSKQATPPRHDRRRDRSPEVRPGVQRSAGAPQASRGLREASVERGRGASERSEDDMRRWKRDKYDVESSAAKPVPLTDNHDRHPRSHKIYSTRREQERERDGSEATGSMQHHQQSSGHQHDRSPLRHHSHSRGEGASDGGRQASPERRPAASKRHRHEHRDPIPETREGPHEELPHVPQRGRSKGRSGDEGSWGGGYRDADLGQASVHDERDEKAMSRGLGSREKGGGGRGSRGEEQLQHKGSRRHNKDGRRDRTMREEEPAAQRRHASRGRSVDAREAEGVHEGRTHARLRTGASDSGSPRRTKRKEPDSHNQSPVVAQAHTLRDGGSPLPQRRLSGSPPLPPPPQAGASRPQGPGLRTLSPVRAPIHGLHASDRQSERVRSPTHDVFGGMRGRSATGRLPPGSPSAAGGVDVQGSPDRRSKQSASHRQWLPSDRTSSPSMQHGRWSPPPPGRLHRPVPPPAPRRGPPPAPFAQRQSRQQCRAPFMDSREQQMAAGDDWGGHRGGWLRPTERFMHEHPAAGVGDKDGADAGQPQDSSMLQPGHLERTAAAAEDKAVEESERPDRQQRARFPLPLVLPGYAVVGGVAQGRTMPAALSVWRRVVARELHVTAPEDSVVGAAVRSLTGHGDEDGKEGGAEVQADIRDADRGSGRGWNMFHGALRRSVDPAACLEVQPKLRVQGTVELSDDAWRKKVQACTNTVFQCSELLKVMKQKREAALQTVCCPALLVDANS